VLVVFGDLVPHCACWLRTTSRARAASHSSSSISAVFVVQFTLRK
jgi:hypothetical protein